MKHTYFIVYPAWILIGIIWLIGEVAYGQEQYRPERARTVKEFRNVYLPLEGLKSKITLEVVDGIAVLEGDIVLGAADRIERIGAVAIDGATFRWVEGVIPFEIAANHPLKSDIDWAIAHVNDKTNLILRPKTSSDVEFIRFVSGSGCSSPVGRQAGSVNTITLGNCSKGSIAHEILHSAGLWHEQSREDRNTFVRIDLQNVQAGKEHNFNQHISDATDIAAYDYGSIMHYGSKDFSKNGKNTITVLSPPAPSGTTIGQRNGLSQADIKAVNGLYPENYFYLQFLKTNLTPFSGAPIANAQVTIMNSNTKDTDPFKENYEKTTSTAKFFITRSGQFTPAYVDKVLFQSMARTDQNGVIQLAFNPAKLTYRFSETVVKEYIDPSKETEVTEHSTYFKDVPDIYFVVTVFNTNGTVRETINTKGLANGFFKNYANNKMGSVTTPVKIGVAPPIVKSN